MHCCCFLIMCKFSISKPNICKFCEVIRREVFLKISFLYRLLLFYVFVENRPHCPLSPPSISILLCKDGFAFGSQNIKSVRTQVQIRTLGLRECCKIVVSEALKNCKLWKLTNKNKNIKALDCIIKTKKYSFLCYYLISQTRKIAIWDTVQTFSL